MIDLKELEKLAEKLKQELEKEDQLRCFRVNKKIKDELGINKLIGFELDIDNNLHQSALQAVGKWKRIKHISLVYASKKKMKDTECTNNKGGGVCGQ